MINNKIIINSDQKKKSFGLIKEVISKYVHTLEKITEDHPTNDIFNKTSKILIVNFTKDLRILAEEEHKEEIELSSSVIDILNDTLNFYWSNGRVLFERYNENDYINACNLLNSQKVSFIK